MKNRLIAIAALIATQALFAMENNNNDIQRNMIGKQSSNGKLKLTDCNEAEASAIAILLHLGQNTKELAPKNTDVDKNRTQQNQPAAFNCTETGCTNNASKGFVNQDNLNRHILKQHTKSSEKKK